MPELCIDDRTTATHRRSWLATFLLAQEIDDLHGDPSEPRPTRATRDQAIELIREVQQPRLVGRPDVDAFCGEIHLSWTDGDRQIVLMFFQNRGPLIHHYERIPNHESRHGIEDATADRLTQRLRWLDE